MLAARTGLQYNTFVVYEVWLREMISKAPQGLETFCQRALQSEHPDLYVERRGGTGDKGRDLVIKQNLSEVVPQGTCQVSAERPWQHKFRGELRALVRRVKAGDLAESPREWIFLTTQPVHEKKKPSRTESPRDKDDELAWARKYLEHQGFPQLAVEIWGFQDLLAIVAHPVKGKQIRAEFCLTQYEGETVEDWLGAFSQYTQARLDKAVTVMPILGHIERVEEGLLEQSLNENGGTLLLGEGGAGKTAVATIQACRLIEAGHPVLWLRASSLPSGIVTPDQLGSHVGVSTPLVTALSTLGRAMGECYVFCDQMSFASGTDTARTLCGLAQTASAMGGLHVVLICRTYHARSQDIMAQLRFPTVEVRPLSRGLVMNLLSRLNVAQPSEVLLTLGENILQLSMIAELARDGVDVEHISGELELWKVYLHDLEVREGQEALVRAMDYAVANLQQSKREWYIAKPDSATERLIARGVLVERQTHVYAFKYDRLHDFLYAWHATRTRKGARAVLDDVDSVYFAAISDWMIKIYTAENPELALSFAEDVLCG